MSRARVVLIACLSLDGFIARFHDDVPNQVKYGGWTSTEDKEIFKAEVVKSDVLLMGRNTYETMPRMKKETMVVSNRNDMGRGVGVVLPERAAMESWLAHEEGRRVLLCGGAMTYSSMLGWDLVDELILTIEPLIFGGGLGLSDIGDSDAAEMLRFKLTSGSRLNGEGTLCLRYART